VKHTLCAQYFFCASLTLLGIIVQWDIVCPFYVLYSAVNRGLPNIQEVIRNLFLFIINDHADTGFTFLRYKLNVLK